MLNLSSLKFTLSVSRNQVPYYTTVQVTPWFINLGWLPKFLSWTLKTVHIWALLACIYFPLVSSQMWWEGTSSAAGHTWVCFPELCFLSLNCAQHGPLPPFLLIWTSANNPITQFTDFVTIPEPLPTFLPTASKLFPLPQILHQWVLRWLPTSPPLA